MREKYDALSHEAHVTCRHLLDVRLQVDAYEVDHGVVDRLTGAADVEGSDLTLQIAGVRS